MGSGQVKGCLNGGVCVDKDQCKCLRTPSVLPVVHPFVIQHPILQTLKQYTKENLCPNAPPGTTCVDDTLPVPSNVTGWIGTDCSIPVCSQGWYTTDHSQCEGVTFGGEGELFSYQFFFNHTKNRVWTHSYLQLFSYQFP